MPQLNSDEAANDEPKTYNDEAIGEDDCRGWNSVEAELADLKGDLVKDDDVEGVQRRRSYDSKGNSHHNDTNHRHKDDLDRDLNNDSSRLGGFPYAQQEIGRVPSVSGISNPLFPNVILPPSSSQVPFNPYHAAIHPLLYGASSPTDMEGKLGISRGGHPDIPTMYSLPGQLGQIPNPLAPHWSSGVGPMYPMCTASAMASMLRYPYPFGSYSTTSGAMSNVSPFPLVPPHPGGLHPSMLQHRGIPGLPPHLANGQNGPKSMPEKKGNESNERERGGGKRREKGEKGGHPYVKKPLNAFMLYMKEQRAKVVAECTLKESAAINQILGRKWHSLNRDEQQKYYELARKERQLHMQMFPGWSARDNYGKRKKRKKEKTQDCTASYYGRIGPPFASFYPPTLSLPKRRKKKCVRYQHDDDSDDDSDGSPYQASPDGSYAQPNSVGNHSTVFDANEHSVLSGGASSNSSNQSGSSLLCDRLSPPQGVVGSEGIKRENGTPPNNNNSGDGKTNNNNNMEMFHPSSSSTSSHTASSFSSTHSSESIPKRSRKEPSKSYSDTNSFRPVPNHHPNPGKNNTEPRAKRSHSQTLPSPMHPNLFNPMLSPTSMGLNSPHGNPHPAFFPHMPPYLQMSTLAAAASMPASPLGGLMGFTGLGLSSPMSMGMSGAGATPGVHSGSNPSRHATSALEGKS